MSFLTGDFDLSVCTERIEMTKMIFETLQNSKTSVLQMARLHFFISRIRAFFSFVCKKYLKHI